MPGAPSAISPNVSQPSYGLTDAGRDLHEVRVVMGASGTRWLELSGQDLDPYVILWACAASSTAATCSPSGGSPSASSCATGTLAISSG